MMMVMMVNSKYSSQFMKILMQLYGERAGKLQPK